ncbi:MAG: DUF5723 family protein [Bacteroidales bacterium]
MIIERSIKHTAKYLIVTFLLLFHFYGRAQEMLGIVQGNYSGIYSLGLNPANMSTSRLYMDFNLIGAQGFLNNNYMYVDRNDFYRLVFSRELPEYYTEEDELRHYSIYRDVEYKYGYQNAKVTGPSAMVVYGKHAFALSTSFRTITGFTGLPNDIGEFLYEAIDFEKQHDINFSHDLPIDAGSLSWFELGLSYAYNFHRFRWNFWSAGITLKPLFGTAGFYTRIENLNYWVDNDSLAYVQNANFRYAISLPLNYTSNDFETSPLFRGYGFGIDAGITFQKTTKGHENFIYRRLCEFPYDKYNYRIGLSIIDLGYIKFSENAIYESYTNAYTTWYKPEDVLPDSSINTIVAKVNHYFGTTNESSEKEPDFVMYTPPAVSLQADVWLRKNFFISGLFIYGINHEKIYIKRPSIFAITPRFETARIEVSLPISIYNWEFNRPRIGFAFRYGNVFFGFDNLNTIFGVNDFRGLDAYAGIRLNLSNAFRLNFIKGICGRQNMRNIETFDFRNF